MSIDKIANSSEREESIGRRLIGPVTRYALSALILLTAYSVGCRKEPVNPKAQTASQSVSTAPFDEPCLLGWYYVKKGYNKDAISQFNQVIDEDPNYSLAHYGRGHAHMAMGHNQEAVADFTKVIELDPNNGGAYLYRSNVHKELGNVDEMNADLAMAQKLGAFK